MSSAATHPIKLLALLLLAVTAQAQFVRPSLMGFSRPMVAGSPTPTPSPTPAPSLNTGLLAYWKLDEASGTRHDATGNSNDLVPVGAVGYSSGVAGFATPHAVFSGGTGGYLSCSHLVLPVTSNWTVTATFAGGMTQLVASCIVANGQAQNIVYNMSRIYANCYAVDGSYPGITATQAWDTAKHIATFVRSGTTLSLYIDGYAAQTTTVLSGNSRTQNSTFTVGGVWLTNGPGNNHQIFNGGIGNVGCWERSLSPAEISALHSGATYPF